MLLRFFSSFSSSSCRRLLQLTFDFSIVGLLIVPYLIYGCLSQKSTSKTSFFLKHDSDNDDFTEEENILKNNKHKSKNSNKDIKVEYYGESLALMPHNHETEEPNISKTINPMAWAQMPRCRCCMPFNAGDNKSSSIKKERDNEYMKLMISTDVTIILVDTHNHIHQYSEEDFDGKNQQNNIGLKDNVQIAISVVLSVGDLEWEDMLTFGGHSPTMSPTNTILNEDKHTAKLVIGLGIHPWYVQEARIGWEKALERLLVKHPSVIVGEIGLCKCARNLRGFEGKRKYWPMQQSFFKIQLIIATRLHRPVSVHCVKAYGAVMNVFYDTFVAMHIERQAQIQGGTAANTRKEEMLTLLPPTIALHSYSGTEMQVDEILAFEQLVKEPIEDRSILPRNFVSWANQRAKKMKVAARSTTQQKTNTVKNISNDNHIQIRTEESSGFDDDPGPVVERYPIFYFGFSHTINVAMGDANVGEKHREKLLSTINSVPSDRILVESDEVGDAGLNKRVETLDQELTEDEQKLQPSIPSSSSAVPLANFEKGQSSILGLNRSTVATIKGLALIAEAKGWTLEKTAKITSENAVRYLNFDKSLSY